MLTTSTQINHISSSHIDNILESAVHKVFLSDNYMVVCKCKLNAKLVGGDRLVVTKNMLQFSEKAFLADILSISWE